MSEETRKFRIVPSGWGEVVSGEDCVAVILSTPCLVVTPAEARRLAAALIVQADRVEDAS